MSPRVTAVAYAGANKVVQLPPVQEWLVLDLRRLTRPAIGSAAIITNHEDSGREPVMRKDGQSVFVDAQEPIIER